MPSQQADEFVVPLLSLGRCVAIDAGTLIHISSLQKMMSYSDIPQQGGFTEHSLHFSGNLPESLRDRARLGSCFAEGLTHRLLMVDSANEKHASLHTAPCESLTS